MFALIFGIIFSIGALGLLAYVVYPKLTKFVPATPVISQSYFLFAFDKESYIDVSKTRVQIFENITKAIQEFGQTKDNTYTDLVFFRSTTDTKNNSRISAAELFDLYEIKLPTVISRSISKDFVYGLYKTNDRVEPFLVIGLVDYENAYDAMFDWEDTLALDIREFFPNLKKVFEQKNIVPQQEMIVSTSTIKTETTTKATSTSATSTNNKATTTATSTIQATSTPSTSVLNRNVTFMDVVLSNKDTRAVRDNNGTPYFYYTFIDRDKILFAQDPKLITEIVRKIKEKQLVR